MVKQRTKSDCGIAAVANATGNTYKSVRSRYGGTTRGGLLISDLNWLMWEFGSWKRIRRPSKRVSVFEWAKRRTDGRYIVIVQSGFLPEDCHVVAVVNGEVLGHSAEHWPVVSVWKMESQ